MTLYDEYRQAHPIAAEPSEFRDIIEAEVRRALEWMRGRDALSERHQRLVEAARAVLDIDDTGALSEDNKDKLFALKAALEGEG